MKRYLRISLLALLLLMGCSQTVNPNTTPTTLMEEYPPAPTPPNSLPELINVLSGENHRARIGAAYKLGEMGIQAESAIPALSINLYYKDSFRVRQAAAWALGEIGPEAKSSAPILITVMLTDFAHTSAEAAGALGKIGDVSAIPALVQGLEHEYIGTGIEAAKSIANLTGQEFPDLDGIGGYTLDSDGNPLIVIAAQDWWKEEGQYQEWLRGN